MTNIKTLALCIDADDPAYIALFRDEDNSRYNVSCTDRAGLSRHRELKPRTFQVGDIENTLEFYNLDERIERVRMHGDQKSISDYLNRRGAHEAGIAEERVMRVFFSSLSHIKSSNNDIVVTGHTPDAEKFVLFLKNSGLLVVRYSMYYGTDGAREHEGCLEPDKAGYSLDCPQEPQVLLAFLQDYEVLESVADKDKARLKQAVERFNQGRKEPVITTDFLSQLWRS